MQRLLARLRRSSAQERMLGGGAFAAVFAAAALTAMLRRDPSAPLYAAPLALDQVAQVASTLSAWDVAYTAGPDNLRVDASRRNDILLRLSIAGVPSSHLASRTEALAKAGALTPQAVIDAEQAEGLGNDIAIGLRGVGGVREARVIVAPARPALFGDESAREATASVRLTLAPGASLDAKVAEGVRRFVAASVPGLDAARVALLDDRASALAPEAAAIDDSAAQQTSLQSALDAAFGPGAAIVRIHEEYDRLTHEVRDVKRTPLTGEPIARTTLDERYSNERKQYARLNRAEDRGSDVRDERTDVPAGRLARMSIAIAVDRSRHLDLPKLRSLAGASAGLDPSRGDTIDVEEVDFAASPAAPPPAIGPIVSAVAWALPAAAAALALAAAIVALGKPLIRLVESALERAKVGTARRIVAGYAPSQVRGALRGEPPHTAAAIISALPAATATAVLELYPPEERAAIVRRMARAASPLVPDVESLLQRG